MPFEQCCDFVFGSGLSEIFPIRCPTSEEKVVLYAFLRANRKQIDGVVSVNISGSYYWMFLKEPLKDTGLAPRRFATSLASLDEYGVIERHPRQFFLSDLVRSLMQSNN
jgi:hypothetical protein